MGDNRKLALNMAFTIIGFAINTCITFFLSPFIVGHLGRAAYGFIGLSGSLLSYTSLITVALNAMAGRFISLSYMRGDVKSANQYFSSVFFSNMVFAGIILLLSIFLLIYIDSIFDVPANLLFDVRLLFFLLVIQSVISLVMNQFGIATFIRNKLYLGSIRSIIGSFLSAAILFLTYGLLTPHIWYTGLSGLAITIYTVCWNVKFRNNLTPDLRINIQSFEFKKVIELIKSGAWNIINRLSNILSQGFDLVFANIFVGAAAMGTFSLSKTLSMMTLSLMGQISGNFSPQLTNLYAAGRIDLVVHELKKSIRVISCFSTPILCSLYLFSGDFFRVWLPGQNWKELWLLATLGFIASPFTLPQEALWNVFTITNKLKYSSLTLLVESICVFSSVLLMMNLFHDALSRLVILASMRTLWGFFRSMLFLPMYAAHCLEQKLITFFSSIFHSVFGLATACGFAWLIRTLLPANSWGMLIVDVAMACFFGFTCNFFFVMTRHDRTYLLSRCPIVKNYIR